MTQYDQVDRRRLRQFERGPVHFGLGKDAGADPIEIRWPSGTVQTLRDVRGGSVVHVKEPLR